MFAPKVLFAWMITLAIQYGGVLLFFVVIFEAIHYWESAEQEKRDRRGAIGFYLFTAAVVLNVLTFSFSELYDGNVHFVRPLFFLCSFLLLIASFAVVWGRQRILLQVSSSFLIACEAALLVLRGKAL